MCGSPTKLSLSPDNQHDRRTGEPECGVTPALALEPNRPHFTIIMIHVEVEVEIDDDDDHQDDLESLMMMMFVRY